MMLHLLIRHLPCVDVGKEVTSADESLLYDVQMSLSIYSVPALLIFQAVGAGVGGYVPQRPRNFVCAVVLEGIVVVLYCS